MPETNVYLPAPLNISVQPGDIAYYLEQPTNVGGFETNDIMTRIGIIKSISFTDTDGDGIDDVATLLCDISATTTPPPVGSFIFFGNYF